MTHASSSASGQSGPSRAASSRRAVPSSKGSLSSSSSSWAASSSSTRRSSASSSKSTAPITGLVSGCSSSSNDHDDFVVYAPMITGKGSKTSSCGKKNTTCTCGSNIQAILNLCLPPLPAIPQAIVDVWLTSPESWKSYDPGPSHDQVLDMYDPLLVNPLDPLVVNTFIEIMTQFNGRDSLFLPTTFHDKLGSFCLCSDGKCKYKENVPLETALKAAGHEGVKLYNHDRVFFPAVIRGTWMAVFLDSTSGKNLVYDPCGQYQVSPDTVTLFARDMSVLLAGEVEKHTPPFETHFDKNPFEIITPDAPIDQRFGALLVLCAMEVFAALGLPESTESATLAFTTLSNLVAAGGSDDWDTAIRKLFAANGHDTSFSKSGNALTKLTKPKIRKTKNLKARISDANKPRNLSKRAAAKVVPAPSSPPSTSESAEMAEITQTILQLALDIKQGFPKAHSPTTSKKFKARKRTTNAIEKVLLDRIVWTVGMGLPPHIPQDFTKLVQEQFAAAKAAQTEKGKGKGKEN